jgi:hypothetical protein
MPSMSDPSGGTWNYFAPCMPSRAKLSTATTMYSSFDRRARI